MPSMCTVVENGCLGAPGTLSCPDRPGDSVDEAWWPGLQNLDPFSLLTAPQGQRLCLWLKPLFTSVFGAPCASPQQHAWPRHGHVGAAQPQCWGPVLTCPVLFLLKHLSCLALGRRVGRPRSACWALGLAEGGPGSAECWLLGICASEPRVQGRLSCSFAPARPGLWRCPCPGAPCRGGGSGSNSGGLACIPR